MFDKFEVLLSWKLSSGFTFSYFLALVMDTFSSIFQIIALLRILKLPCDEM